MYEQKTLIQLILSGEKDIEELTDEEQIKVIAGYRELAAHWMESPKTREFAESVKALLDVYDASIDPTT